MSYFKPTQRQLGDEELGCLTDEGEEILLNEQKSFRLIFLYHVMVVEPQIGAGVSK